MLDRSDQESTGNQTWRIRARIILVVLLLATLPFAMKLYMVQEILVVLLLVALAMTVVLVFAVTFVLFQEGIRRTVVLAKTGVVRLAGLSHRPVGPREPTIHSPLPR